MRKIVAIPAHIVNSGDADHWFNIVNGSTNRIGTIFRSSNNMQVYNIRKSQIKNILGESADNLIDLLTSANINANAYYKSSGSANLSMNAMAGYNHLAKPSTYYANEKWTALTLYAQADGENYKVVLPLQLRRGEIIPAYSGNVTSWSTIKVVVKLYDDEEIPNLLETVTTSNVNVSQMRNSTIVNVNIPILNADDTFKLLVESFYTHGSENIIEDTWSQFVLTVKAIAAYNLIAPLILVPNYGYSTYGVNIANDGGAAYIGQIHIKFNFWWDGTNVSFYGTSDGVSIYPEGTELVFVEWGAGVVPAPGPTGWNNEKEYSITLYEGDSVYGDVIETQVWNSGL